MTMQRQSLVIIQLLLVTTSLETKNVQNASAVFFS